MASKAHNLKEDKVAEIKEILSNFEQGQTGQYSCTDIGTILRVLGHNPDSEEIEKFEQRVDSKKKGYFELKELLKTLKEFVFTDPTAQEIESAMGLLDQEKIGRIDASLLKEILTQYEERLSEEECEMILRTVDPDGTGKVDVNQFMETIK